MPCGAGGRGVLVLVPEIALTPQVAALFRARFGEAVAIQHSGLSDGERHDQWHRIRRGDVDVVIGTRSAVFAPLANPGLIIVDEEHDTSYKQDETPRYHGRDVAIMRGKFAGALVVIGSATPTIESYTNALEGHYTMVSMEKRVLDRPLARVSVVNMREEIAEAGEDVVLSRPLLAAIDERLDARRAVVDPAESPRLRHRGRVPSVHGHARVPELQHLAHRPQPVAPKPRRRRRLEGAMSLLQLLEAGAEDVRKVRGAVHGARRVRHRARRSGDPEVVSGRADRARRSRHRAPQGQPGRDAGEGRRSRGRHPDRHADDREGPRLSRRARWSA